MLFSYDQPHLEFWYPCAGVEGGDEMQPEKVRIRSRNYSTMGRSGSGLAPHSGVHADLSSQY